jgi:hypothetical protein
VWGILSALHHVVEPDHPLGGYDWTMKNWRKDELETWAALSAYGYPSVRRLVCTRGCVTSCRCLRQWTVEIHAGAAYVDPLRPRLLAEGAKVDVPLAGLGIGEQLHWYTVRLERPDPQMRLGEAA